MIYEETARCLTVVVQASLSAFWICLGELTSQCVHKGALDTQTCTNTLHCNVTHCFTQQEVAVFYFLLPLYLRLVTTARRISWGAPACRVVQCWEMVSQETRERDRLPARSSHGALADSSTASISVTPPRRVLEEKGNLFCLNPPLSLWRFFACHWHPLREGRLCSHPRHYTTPHHTTAHHHCDFNCCSLSFTEKRFSVCGGILKKWALVASNQQLCVWPTPSVQEEEEEED